jgi:hypothetical protein
VSDDDRGIIKIELTPENYGLALSEALQVIKAAHPIIVAAVQTSGVNFRGLEKYLFLLDSLQETCGCEGIISSAFTGEAIENWRDVPYKVVSETDQPG